MDNALALSDYQPQAELITPCTTLTTPAYPVLDGHNHLGALFGPGWINRPLKEGLERMDDAHVRAIVDMDGGFGEAILQQHLDAFKAHAPDRFYHFGGVDWTQFPERGDAFGAWAAQRIREQVRWGAQGLKIWKVLGLNVRDQRGTLVRVNDPRLQPIWATAAELHLPVTIHVGDPAAFFKPITPANERWEELQAHPDWHFPAPPYPPLLNILEDLKQLVRANPLTTFIGAHVGCYAENLAWVGHFLDEAPNFYVDICARIAELGRQPYRAREFFIRYQDRIIFGTDMIDIDPDVYRLHFRFLETADEYFPYSLAPVPPQGRWNIYGLHLPKTVLRKIYARNMAAILQGKKQ